MPFIIKYLLKLQSNLALKKYTPMQLNNVKLFLCILIAQHLMASTHARCNITYFIIENNFSNTWLSYFGTCPLIHPNYF